MNYRFVFILLVAGLSVVLCQTTDVIVEEKEDVGDVGEEVDVQNVVLAGILLWALIGSVLVTSFLQIILIGSFIIVICHMIRRREFQMADRTE